MSQTTNQLPEGARRTLAILNSRKTILLSHVGSKKIYAIQGDGTYLTADQQRKADETAGKEPAKAYFNRRIYNLKANSAEAMERPAVKTLFKQGVIAEMKGDMETANSLYNQFLNSCQVSFNMIDNGRSRVFRNGDDVKVLIGLTETKAGFNAITVSEPTVVEAEFGTAVKFAITDFVDEDTLNGVEHSDEGEGEPNADSKPEGGEPAADGEQAPSTEEIPDATITSVATS